MENKPTYTIIPNKALDALVEKGATVSDIVVYQVLCRHYNLEDNKCWPSLNVIAKVAGCSQRNVQRSIIFLSSSGMILKLKSKYSNNAFENNSYLLPHLVSFQIEKLLSEKKTPTSTKKIKVLRDLENFILKAIQETLGKDNLSLGRDIKSLSRDKKAGGRDKPNTQVGTGSPTNNTTINTTINITKNVNKDKNENNDDFTSGLKQLKRFDRDLSKPYPEAIGGTDTLIKIKREGLVQQLATELNDEKSIPYFRGLVSKLTEDIIYKCLSLTKETQELSGIKTSRGAVFTDHIKREAERLGVLI